MKQFLVLVKTQKGLKAHPVTILPPVPIKFTLQYSGTYT
jgi:hypothetical protein